MTQPAGALVKALEEIRDHWANQYDHPRKENEMYRGPYGVGVTDGHRACAIIAEKALNASMKDNMTAPDPRCQPDTAKGTMLADDIDNAVSIGIVLFDPIRNSRENRYLSDAEIASIVAALRAAPNWQPIETAPKDKTIMLCVEGFEPCAGRWWPIQGCWSSFDWEGHFESDQDANAFYHGSRYDPTHWMPLPEGPSVTRPHHSPQESARE